MQISKSLVACSVALLCLVSIPARGQDSPEEARLREALRQKMDEAKSNEAVAPAPSTAPEPAPEVVAPAPVAVAPAPVVVAPAPVVIEPAPVVVAPAPVVAEPVLAPSTAPVVETPQVTLPTTPEPAAALIPAGDDSQAARLRQVLRERMDQGTATPIPDTTVPATIPSTTVTTAPTITAEPVLSNTAVINSSTTVVVAPAPAPAPVVLEPAPTLPISGSKSERLASLLQQYKADEITPQQYHEARARILAE